MQRVPTAAAVTRALKKLGTPARATASAWYFKTDKGQYGHGDVFIGVSVPEQRKVAKEFVALSLEEIAKLLQSTVHECRLTALLILVGQYQKAGEKEKARITGFYLAHRARVNNWDLVDCSAPYLLGQYAMKNKKGRKILYTLARSKSLWDRRIAIVSTLALIRAGEYEDTLKITELLLGDAHDLIHKASGWMLREVGKMSLPTLEGFLQEYKGQMPRTMLRYAIERFPEGKRKALMVR